MTPALRVSAVALALGLGACQTDLNEIGRQPRLTPVGAG